MNFKNLFFLIVICLIGYLSYQIAILTRETDFSVFYCAGKIVLDPDIPSRMVYDIKTLTTCAVPEVLSDEHRQQLHFIYSIPAAYLLSPIMLLPYFQAKALLITVNMLSYAVSIHMLLNRVSPQNPLARSKYFLLSFFWPPLLDDVLYGQINAIILLLICMASILAKRKPYLSGLVFGIASLIKLFPLGVAVFFGLKNWRVTAACFLTICLGILISGSQDWFVAVFNVNKVQINPIYKLLAEYNIFWYLGYVMAVLGITALTILSSSSNYFFITAVAIPTIFVVMPIPEYYHFVLLIFSITYIILNIKYGEWFMKLMIIMPIVLISIGKYYDIDTRQVLMVFSNLILWALLIIQKILHRRLKVADSIGLQINRI